MYSQVYDVIYNIVKINIINVKMKCKKELERKTNLSKTNDSHNNSIAVSNKPRASTAFLSPKKTESGVRPPSTIKKPIAAVALLGKIIPPPEAQPKKSITSTKIIIKSIVPTQANIKSRLKQSDVYTIFTIVKSKLE
jgi:hypothetical protein